MLAEAGMRLEAIRDAQAGRVIADFPQMPK